MKDSSRRALFVLVAALMALDFYAIFSAGSRRSLFRLITAETRWDVPGTLLLSFGVAALVLVLTRERRGRLRGLLDMNRDFILELRRKGRSDPQIAQSFLDELKAPPGLLRSLVRGRVMRYLSRLK